MCGGGRGDMAWSVGEGTSIGEKTRPRWVRRCTCGSRETDTSMWTPASVGKGEGGVVIGGPKQI
jgi:hypothetical protein